MVVWRGRGLELSRTVPSTGHRLTQWGGSRSDSGVGPRPGRPPSSGPSAPPWARGRSVYRGVCVCTSVNVCVPGYRGVHTEVLITTVCSPGSGSPVSGFGSVWDCVDVCALASDPRVYTNQGSRTSFHVRVISRLMPLCVPSGYRCGQKVSPSVLAFVHECVPVCPRSGMGPRADAAAWGKAGEGLASPCGLGETGLRAEGGDSPPLPRQRRRAPGSRGVLAGLRRLERRRRPAGRDQIHARTGTATTAAAGLSPRRSDGGRGVSATRRRPGAPRSGGGPAACCRW